MLSISESQVFEWAGSVCGERLPGSQVAKPPRSIEDSLAIERACQGALARVMPAVVRVGTASGVIVSEDGLILTAAHLKAVPSERIGVLLPDGTRVTAKAKTMGVFGQADMAILKMDGEGPYPFVALGDAGSLTEGDWCLMAGHMYPL